MMTEMVAIEVIGTAPPGLGDDALLRAASMLADYLGGFTFAPHAARITRQDDGAEFVFRVTGHGTRVVFDTYPGDQRAS